MEYKFNTLKNALIFTLLLVFSKAILAVEVTDLYQYKAVVDDKSQAQQRRANRVGFIGVLGLLFVYLLIIFRCLFIAVKAQDSYSRILSGGLVLTFFIYIFVNIGMVSGLLPVVGVPLPLVSYGGTSMVTLMAGFGILMAISTHRRFHA